MFISHYPWNLMLGNIEFSIMHKLVRGEDLTEEEETRADQMSVTMDQMVEKKAQDQRMMRMNRQHRLGVRKAPSAPREGFTPATSTASAL